jgi:hypothetical protein
LRFLIVKLFFLLYLLLQALKMHLYIFAEKIVSLCNAFLNFFQFRLVHVHY